MPHRPLSPAAIAGLTANTEPWLSCDDCFDQIDSAVEGLLDGRTPFTEAFRVHLAACPVCIEEARTLAGLVADDLGLTSGDAVARVDAAVRGTGTGTEDSRAGH